MTVDQRIIPNITVPPEQTMASLRKMLRQAHAENRLLREALMKAAKFFEREWEQHTDRIEHFQAGGSQIDPEYRREVDRLYAMWMACEDALKPPTTEASDAQS